MRLVTARIVAQLDDKTINSSKAGSSPTTIYCFKGFETDFDGARIPCIFETNSKKVADFLKEQSPDMDLYIPFTRTNEYMGKTQFSVDHAILNMPEPV